MDKYIGLGSRISAIFAILLIVTILAGCTQDTPSDQDTDDDGQPAADANGQVPPPSTPSSGSPAESTITQPTTDMSNMSTESIEDTVVGTLLDNNNAIEQPTSPLTIDEGRRRPEFGVTPPPATMPPPATSPTMTPPGTVPTTIPATIPATAPTSPYSMQPPAARPTMDNSAVDYPPYHRAVTRPGTSPTRNVANPSSRPAAPYGMTTENTAHRISDASALNQDLIPIQNCQVSLLDDVDVPAKESGVLTELPVREGSLATEGDIIAKIDQRIALLQEKAAQNRLEVAEKEATNQISVEYARATAEVAWAEILAAEAANSRVPGTVTTSELRRLKLQHYEATQSIKNAQKKLEIAALEANVARAELDAAKEGVDRRLVRSPISGEVTLRYKNKGEWVQPGEPVLRMIRLDVLRVEGSVDPNMYSPSEIDGRPVTVEVELERGRRERFNGKIVFIDPTIQSNNTYIVWAEVKNAMSPDGRHWLLGPGRTATMTIHLKDAQTGQ